MSAETDQAEEAATAPAPPMGEKEKNIVLAGKSDAARLILLNTAITILIVVVAIVVYNIRASHGNQRIGIMDVAEIYQSAQAKLGTEYLSNEATDQQREKIKQEYQSFGKKLETTIDQIMNECNCVLVVRDAVLTTNATDYTATAKQRLGL
ncbi:MAG: hypothetical protein ACYC9J_06365 [Sulfuricaulis sp.]